MESGQQLWTTSSKVLNCQRLSPIRAKYNGKEKSRFTTVRGSGILGAWLAMSGKIYLDFQQFSRYPH